ncbi:MAG TPA: efflux RND transporter periplasmic adaptor subunit [Candidatus Binatia bacterium]|nr:efflux RND transporter periplasmic adaptor subunit [Candidatus Binatia bacterium]
MRALSAAVVTLVVAVAHGAGVSDTPRVPIRLDAAERQAIGLTWGTVERRSLERTVRAVGRLAYDERRLTDVTLKVGGWVEDLLVDYTGASVERGAPLLTLYSPDLVTAEQEYLLARETAARLAGSSVAGAEESADSLLRASRERLRLWDLDDAQVRALERSRRPTLAATIRAPRAGVVVEKAVVRGSRVEPGMALYRIADLSTVWVLADVYEIDLPFVHLGQAATVTVAAVPGRTFPATVAWIAPALDPKTRTARVRLDLANRDGVVLRPDMYGDVAIAVPLGERLVVPETAVLDSGRHQVVFVDGGDGRLIPRPVTLGSRLERWAEVLDGVAAGERVATSANFLVDSESRLEAAESMMGMMGALGMADTKMESAKPMEMQPGAPPPPAAAEPEEKAVGDLRVALFPAHEPAVVGENALRVRVRDASGAPVTGATVRLHYTMDMPGMAIEESAAKELGGGVYEAPARLTMAGPWSVVVEVARAGGTPARERFTVRAGGSTP